MTSTSWADERPRRVGPGLGVRPTAAEVVRPLPSDDIVPGADVVMNRVMVLSAPPEAVWPWLAQLGKQRAGWYLPAAVEHLLPRRRRALRELEPRWLSVAPGAVVPDWGGSFTAVVVNPPHALVYRSERGRTGFSWALVLDAAAPGHTRVQLRLRLGPVRHRRLAALAGGCFDWLTVVGLQAGLRERVR